MKKILIILIGILSLNKVNAQSMQDFFRSCVITAKKNGATKVIVSAELCSACRWSSISQGFVFSKDTFGNNAVRGILYYDMPDNTIKIIFDTTIYDYQISEVFDIENSIHDSLMYQIENIEVILNHTISYQNGQKILTMTGVNHGRMRYLALHGIDSSASSFVSLLSLNHVYSKAKYYWILNSAINNYIQDDLKWFSSLIIK